MKIGNVKLNPGEDSVTWPSLQFGKNLTGLLLESTILIMTRDRFSLSCISTAEGNA